MRLISGFRAAIDRWVHPSARGRLETRLLHREFMAIRVAIAAVAATAGLAWTMLHGAPAQVEVMIMAAGLSPLLAAAVLSCTGVLGLAQFVSSLSLAAALGAVAWIGGGSVSPVAAALLIVPLEAAFAGSRHDIWRASLLALGTLGLLMWLPPPEVASHEQLEFVTFALLLLGATLGLAAAERREAETRHRERDRTQARLALDSVGDLVFIAEPDGRLSYMNEPSRILLGADAREPTQRSILVRINVADRPAFLMALSLAAQGEEARPVQIRLATAGADGSVQVRWCEVSARRLADSVGSRLVIVLRDVTERRLADDAREEARRDAERLAESKSRFLATMSHELRTPLNAIIGFSEMLGDPRLAGTDHERVREYARIINGSGQHLLEVVNAILDMSKIEAGMMTVEQEPVDLRAVIASSVELLAVRAGERGVTLRSEVSPGLPEFVGDRRAAKQVLLNLLSNALKFTPEGGTVTVTLVRDRQMLELAVSDTGVGMTAEELARVGTPFFQACGAYDRQHEGTGLGLSVVRGLVGLMGGQMAIDSAPGAGTRVAVRLPINGRGGARPEPIRIETRVKARATFPVAAPAQHRLSA